MAAHRDEFYVGYAAEAPEHTGRFVRRATLLLLIMAMALVVLAMATQVPPKGPPGSFAYGNIQPVIGELVDQPYPALRIRVGDHDVERQTLVGPGKRGAPPELLRLVGSRVQLNTTRIARAGITMLEVRPDAVALPADADRPLPAAVTTELGDTVVYGEIVDSKCWLGVMRPATHAPHRACAVRCLTGGAPPLLLSHDAIGEPIAMWLADGGGRGLQAALPAHTAVPVAVRGRLRRIDGQLFLIAGPDAIRRMP